MIDESTPKGSISTIFASLSTPIRINIIKSLNEHSQLTFMALLRALNLTPDKDASSLSYHLKVLINSKIIT
ncbi:MAG: helix-turn-helix transcriptional regulator, partial [Candidatus Odinarchaeota archaeon]|nr:helix-turn-helix transcriptional regulator [Candidatus Odinarchaeota archaeon]